MFNEIVIPKDRPYIGVMPHFEASYSSLRIGTKITDVRVAAFERDHAVALRVLGGGQSELEVRQIGELRKILKELSNGKVSVVGWVGSGELVELDGENAILRDTGQSALRVIQRLPYKQEMIPLETLYNPEGSWVKSVGGFRFRVVEPPVIKKGIAVYQSGHRFDSHH